METTMKGKSNNKHNPTPNVDNNRLKYLTRRILNTDPDSEINKFWEEIVQHGGYELLKEKVRSNLFKECYNQEELSALKENLEMYKKCTMMDETILVDEQGDDEQFSLEDLQQARATVFVENEIMEIPISSDSEIEFTENPLNTNKSIIYGSEIYQREANGLCIELRNVIIEKMNELRKSLTPRKNDFKNLQDLLATIVNLQSEYLKAEKDRFSLIEKLKDVNDKQNNNCKEMIQVIHSINDLLSEIEKVNTEEMQGQMEMEVMGFGQKKRYDIWKAYLRKQMESLKSTISKNMSLDG